MTCIAKSRVGKEADPWWALNKLIEPTRGFHEAPGANSAIPLQWYCSMSFLTNLEWRQP
jgi:hypothetical protein